MIVGGIVIAWIGWTMVEDAKTDLGKFLGFFLILLAGALASNVFDDPGPKPFQPDKVNCSQYVWVDDTLTCVPYGEEG
jgi:hypothetical protein